ncbi:Regulator of G-protein signaling 12 [Cyphomyrmex costatus]|uniref:Regulator of G-protein signaling 12 n=1 Tax=Cyphomyrmex costatus TaxID=456900 RepID=A0A195CLK3_9HYME|nr:Regulator of G-protein signaling 12 [Cyphomyrmex costatus]
MVCNSAGSECTTEVDKDVTLKQALEELLKCMLRVWCREGQALAKFGVATTESDKRVVVKREAGGEFGFRIHGSKPVVVSAIEPDTPAESSGLEVGDIIMSVNGRSVMDATHSEVVRLAHSGTDVLELEVARTCNVLAPRVARAGVKESSEEAPLYSGYLWRKSTSSCTEKWVRRWFALRRDNCLYCYKTDSDSQPVGAVMLLKYDVEQTPELRVHGFAIKKKGAPTLRLAADTEEAAARWITVIREAVERNNQSSSRGATIWAFEKLTGIEIRMLSISIYTSNRARSSETYVRLNRFAGVKPAGRRRLLPVERDGKGKKEKGKRRRTVKVEAGRLKTGKEDGTWRPRLDLSDCLWLAAGCTDHTPLSAHQRPISFVSAGVARVSYRCVYNLPHGFLISAYLTIRGDKRIRDFSPL